MNFNNFSDLLQHFENNFNNSAKTVVDREFKDLSFYSDELASMRKNYNKYNCGFFGLLRHCYLKGKAYSVPGMNGYIGNKLFFDYKPRSKGLYSGTPNPKFMMGNKAITEEQINDFSKLLAEEYKLISKIENCLSVYSYTRANNEEYRLVDLEAFGLFSPTFNGVDRHFLQEINQPIHKLLSRFQEVIDDILGKGRVNLFAYLTQFYFVPVFDSNNNIKYIQGINTEFGTFETMFATSTIKSSDNFVYNRGYKYVNNNENYQHSYRLIETYFDDAFKQSGLNEEEILSFYRTLSKFKRRDLKCVDESSGYTIYYDGLVREIMGNSWAEVYSSVDVEWILSKLDKYYKKKNDSKFVITDNECTEIYSVQ